MTRLGNRGAVEQPLRSAIDDKGNIIIADSSNNRIRIVDARIGIISTVAGTGEQGFSGDDGLAVRAQLSGPTGLAMGADGTLFIADSGNSRIRKLDRAQQIIVTIAGSGIAERQGMAGLRYRPNSMTRAEWPSTGTATC